MNREDVYALVWQTPLSQLAKTFGLSDVGLRKICIRHDIPTPPLGYWAKRMHGKPVNQPPLPPSKTGASIVPLVMRADRDLSPAIRMAQDIALRRNSQFHTIVVPAERPKKLHRVAVATRKSLRMSKADHEGFKTCKDSVGVDVTVGLHSIERALLIIHAVTCAAEQRGHSIAAHQDGIRIVVEDVPFRWRLYEIKDRAAHQPTKEELERQAEHEEQRRRWPDLYSSRSTKVYRSWDYFPSGRLAMSFTDATRSVWDQDGPVGRWRDRKNRRLEEYLDEAMAALVACSVAVKHRLAEKAEQERRRADELERRRRVQERREREARRREFMIKKAEEYAVYQKLVALADFIERHTVHESSEAHDRFIADLKSLVATTRKGFDWEALQKEILHLQLYAQDDIADGERREGGHQQ